MRSQPASYGRFRLECLNQHWFLDLQDARIKKAVPSFGRLNETSWWLVTGEMVGY